MGIGVEIFQGPTSEREGGLSLLERARKRLKLRPKTLGADKGYFEKKFIKKPNKVVKVHKKTFLWKVLLYWKT